jgi:hypothetical protein
VPPKSNLKKPTTLTNDSKQDVDDEAKMVDKSTYLKIAKEFTKKGKEAWKDTKLTDL